MSNKEQTPRGDKAGLRRPSPKLVAEDAEFPAQAPADPAALVRRAQHNPRLLSSGDVRQLQRMLGNQAVGQRLSEARPGSVLQGQGTVIQRYTGYIPDSGLDTKAVKAMVSEAETTKFDMRGHAVRRHGQAVTDLEKMTRRDIPLDSSFDTNALVLRTIVKALADHKNTINSWLESTSAKNLVLTVDMSEELGPHETQLGSGMRRFGAMAPRLKVEGLTTATVIFRKAEVPDRKKSDQRARDTEWHLLTAYPSEE